MTMAKFYPVANAPVRSPDKQGGVDRALGQLGARPTAADEAYPIRIAVDGTWFHQGTPIGRPALVRLFSTVLRRDDAGDYWLVTPAERGRITVEDAPFVAVELMDDEPGRLTFRTNVDDGVTAGPDHPIRVAFGADGEPRPYVLVRDRLEALIARTVFYQLVERAEERDGVMGVASGGAFFPLVEPAR
ncbi:MAG: DUF1285 domain-containing protein [Azospirillaceae bacterium]